jgi:radical SAM protein with 4Fe4S-binding SPASM domain
VQQKYKDSPVMDFDICKKIIDDAIQYKTLTHLAFSSSRGDPMLNPGIVDFYEYAYSKNHFKELRCTTNGLAVNNHDVSKLLNTIHRFTISVDSINPDTYKKIHGVNCLDKVIQNIKTLVEYKKKHGAKAQIVVRFTQNELNKGEYPEFKAFFETLGVDEINYNKLHAFAGARKEMADERLAAQCYQYLQAINFDIQGNMTNCCVNYYLEPTFGNIKNKTIKQIWHGKKRKEWIQHRMHHKPCKNCNGQGWLRP